MFNLFELIIGIDNSPIAGVRNKRQQRQDVHILNENGLM